MSKLDKANIKWIPVKDICVLWAKAQRGLREDQAKKIAEEFDPDQLGVLTVTQPDDTGAHHCIDGQTRRRAVEMAFGDDTRVPCEVLQVKDVAHAARIFLGRNTKRNRPSSLDRFRIAVTAGNPTESQVNSLLVSLGYQAGSGASDGVFRAVDLACGIAKKHGVNVLRDALLAIRTAWGHSGEAMEAGLVAGFSLFFAKHGSRADGKRLVTRVSKQYTAARLIGAARLHREMMGSMTIGQAVCALLVKSYDERLKGPQRLNQSVEAA